MSSVRILAPAKINLGLAILGKRPDGYHEIDTIMAMINLCDELRIMPSAQPGISIDGMDDIPVQSNLMTRSARLWSAAAGVDANWHIEIDKRIPSPAGIGGGSSDAVAVLKALNAMHDDRMSHDELRTIAASIGSDCPFFLNGPAARATGIGTDLRPIDPLAGWVVLAIPPVNVSAKTAALYGALTPDDYGSRGEIDIIERMGISASPLINSFTRPAMSTFTGLSDARRQLAKLTGRAMLSGAGPALYGLARSESEADAWADGLRARVRADVWIGTAQFLQSPPEPELLQ